jgi:transcription-repair coupling factor (superfamily II helicase)
VEPARREVKVELPIDAHLPHDYVESQRLRLEGYQRLAKVADEAELAAVAEELVDRYGPLPEPVSNLLAVAAFRIVAAAAGITEVTLQGNLVRFAGVTLSESQLVRLDRLYPKSLVKAPLRTVLIPRPQPATFGAAPIRDAALLAWATEVVQQLFVRQPVAQPVG